jgi:hypothetical protein
VRWPWSKAIDPTPERRSSEQLLIETLQDQIAYLRGELHKSRSREDEIRRQNVLLVDQRAAWNSAAIEERVMDRPSPPLPGERAVREALTRDLPSSEVEYGSFQNSLGTSGHIEFDENGERSNKALRDLTDAELERVMLAREGAAVGEVVLDQTRG